MTTVAITVRSSDLGSDLYVRGEVYFTYFEQSRLAHLRRLGVVPTFPVPDDAENYFAIVETTARYRASANFGDVLLVSTTTEALSNRTFTLSFRVVQEATGVVVAEGRSVQVWLGEDRQPAPIPPRWRTVLASTLTAG
ncbi:MAG: acyl-CoA thioesterase [Vicinamibacterales bacterium]